MARPWTFPEFSPVGVDLASARAVARYDRDQGTDPGRDDALLDRLGVGPGTRFVELACGTGSLTADFEAHVRDEFSTYAWILEGLLERAGFDVEDTDFPRPTHGEFVCRKR